MKSYILFILLLVLLPKSVLAQWTNVMPPNTLLVSTSGGAITFKEGLMWAVDNQNVFISRDSGKSWSKIASTSFGAYVTDVIFYDSIYGVISSSNGVYLTKDQGKSWNQILPVLNLPSWPGVRSICFDGTANDIIMIGARGEVNFTRNQGATWASTSLGATSFYVTSRGNGQAFAWAGPSTAACYISVTTDYGAHWTPAKGGNDYDSYTFGIDSCNDNWVYLANEHDDPRNAPSHVYQSTDQGASWKQVFSAAYPYITGSIAVCHGAIYCPTVSAGVLRSTNSGATWKTIGGANGKIDIRTISAVSENVVVCIGSDGSIWRTANSGGDSVLFTPGTLSVSPTSLFDKDTVLCSDSISQGISTTSIGCAAPSILSWLITGQDSLSYRGWNWDNDSILITFVPKASGENRASLILRLTDGTQMAVLLHGYYDNHGNMSLALSPQGPINLCAGESTRVIVSPPGQQYQWLRNNHLLASTTDSLTISDSGSYTVIVSNPSGCVDSASFVAVIHPLPVASIVGTESFCVGDSTALSASPVGLNYQWKKDGQQAFDTTNSLIVKDSGDYTVIVTNASGCSDSTSVHVSENPLPFATITAQDTIICANASTVLHASGGSSYLWSSGATADSITVDSGTYFVVVTDSNGCSATSWPMTIRSIPAPSVTLQAPPDTSVCANSVVLYVREIHLKNNLPIPQKLYASQSGNAFYGLPDSLILLPGEDTILLDSVLTNGTSPAYSTTCNFHDSCDVTKFSATVNVNANVAPQPLALSLVPSSAIYVHVGDTVSFPVQIHSNACISQLRFFAVHDPDVLSYLRADSSALKLDSITNGGEYFTLFAPPDSGVACDLQFQSYLSAADSTPVTLTLLGYDSTCLPCILSDSVTGSAVTVIHGCGSQLLQQAMESKPILIDGIIPNPVTNDVEVHVSRPGSLPINYEILNVLGAFEMQGSTTGSSVTLSTRDLPAGAYTLRLSSNGFEDSRQFVVVK